MNAVEIAVVVLAVSVPLTVLAVGAAFWFIFKNQEKFLLNVLDRFLSRNMSDYAMTDLVKREIEADQGEEVGEESEDDQAFDKYLQTREAAAELIGVEK